ncbi:MAG: hypothetical protein PSX37_09195, partial [bacterium]|nr:hypothetical protein [bacterium]
CGDWSAHVDGGRLTLAGPAAGGAWDAVRAAARLAWACADHGVALEHDTAVVQLAALAEADVVSGGYGGPGT